MLNFKKLDHGKNPFRSKFFRNSKFENRRFKKIEAKKIGILGTIFLFCITFFLNSSLSANASSQSVLSISKGGTNANNIANAQKNLGAVETINGNVSDDKFLTSKAVYDYIDKVLNAKISMDNINFSENLTNWAGGDLIIKSGLLNKDGAQNKIKVGDTDCSTTGQGYTNNSAADDGISQVGCILPSLAAGTYNVAVSANNGQSYSISAGSIIYAEKPNLSSCDTTSMQTFGADAAVCKAAMQQGQVIVLNDTRNNQKYRVKKMPDGNVWMIDNLKLGSTTSTTTLTPADTNIASNYTLPAMDGTNNNLDPTSSSTYCSASGNTWKDAPGSFTGCGYMYQYDTGKAETEIGGQYSISAKGWSLVKALGNDTKTNQKVFLAAIDAAQDTPGKRNPVYGLTNWNNFKNDPNSVFQAVKSGASYGGVSINSSNYMYQMSDQLHSSNTCVTLFILTTTGASPSDSNTWNLRERGYSIRSVL
ncbi:MAG: hypothetical protein LBT85_02530 [Bifidobacteriaceae bacterium]|jgi:hypothetical protein|nr:hypothetical protein [Bifidobacteriaceae bacterium]